MTDFKSLNLPEELLQRLYIGTKPREMYELNWISFIRPDPHDVTTKLAGVSTVRVWAADAREALHLLEANPQTVEINGEDQELPILVMQSVAPIRSGISEESMMKITNPVFTGSDKTAERSN